MPAKTTNPGRGYRRPPSASSASLIVRVVGESGEEFGQFDFNSVKAPRKLIADLVRAFEVCTGSSGKWRAKTSVSSGATLLASFAAAISANSPELHRMSGFTPEMWWEWRNKNRQKARWPGQIMHVRSLLYEVDNLPNTTRRALKGREKKPKKRSYDAYTASEYRRIYSAAWATVRAARKRIRANLLVLREYQAGNEEMDAPSLNIKKEPWTRGRILDYIFTTGNFPSGQIPGYRPAEFREMLGLESYYSGPHAIFASAPEVYAGIVLIVCERGFNLSVVDGLTANPSNADIGVTVQALDKPRRGHNARYFSSTFSGKSGRIFKAVAEITQPARDHLKIIGTPSDKLLIARAHSGYSHENAFKTEWQLCQDAGRIWEKRVRLVDDAGMSLTVRLMKLRLTEQIVNQRSNQNSERVSESIYRRPDKQTIEIAQDVILQGQKDALSDAEAVMMVRTITADEKKCADADPTQLAMKLNVSVSRVRQLLTGSQDTAVLACIDITSSPFSQQGEVCKASFLKCFSCQNAVVTPKHLSRIVLLHEALLSIASIVSDSVWVLDYKVAYQQISTLLQDYSTASERDAAKKHSSEKDRDAIRDLLDRRFDA